MKKAYLEPTAEIGIFNVIDVISASTEDPDIDETVAQTTTDSWSPRY
ncbi:MAG: hypothetical protein II306_11235 [Clostridia bacterium]|nr:hypothetical protein [Clostridia bacterium]MEE1024145.1 hypothetical protein [Acutalibacteraceae bacterium]